MEIIDHPCHKRHPLRLKPHGEPYMCAGCKEPGFGSRYRCDRCHFNLHGECAKARPDQPRTHRFMGDRIFKFYPNPPGVAARICDACGEDVLAFVYHYPSKRKSLDLHPTCLNLKGHIYDSKTQLELVLKDTVPSECLRCNSKDVGNGSFRGWSYVSKCGNYCFHVSCVKKLILENWRGGYFSRNNHEKGDIIISAHMNRSLSIQESLSRDIGSSSSSTQRDLSRGSSSITRSSSTGRSMLITRRSTRGRSWLSRVGKLAFKLVVSLIFGNPISGIVALVEALVS